MLAPNSTLQQGRYRIPRRGHLSSDGMGAVYEAFDNRLQTKVAIKEALESDPALLRAFEKEALRLARLHHAALPNVLDHFTEYQRQYLVMRFIEGEDLGEMLNRRAPPFPVAQVLEWGHQLLDGVQSQKMISSRKVGFFNLLRERRRGSEFGVRVGSTGIRGSGFGVRVGSTGIRGSGFGIRGLGFGVRGSGFGLGSKGFLWIDYLLTIFSSLAYAKNNHNTRKPEPRTPNPERENPEPRT